MKKSISILSLSRPRFWIYELGPYFLGVLSAGTMGRQLLPETWIWAIYFLFPANIFIYGINDIFDYETDKHNPKKISYEQLLTPDKHWYVWKRIISTNLPFIVYAGRQSNHLLLTLCCFLFFASMYSARPIRAKIRPIWDSVFSAGHYVMTGIFGYFLMGGTTLDRWLIAGAMARSMAMHAYSAIPDIEADKKAKLATVATYCGKQGTLQFCLALYLFAAINTFVYLGRASIVGGLVYSGFMIVSFYEKDLMDIYKIFPRVNTIIGMIIFFVLLFGQIIH